MKKTLSATVTAGALTAIMLLSGVPAQAAEPVTASGASAAEVELQSSSPYVVAPAELSVVSATENSVTLSFVANGNAKAGAQYAIGWFADRTDGPYSYFYGNKTVTVSGLKPDTYYQFSVYSAVDGGGRAAYVGGWTTPSTVVEEEVEEQLVTVNILNITYNGVFVEFIRDPSIEEQHLTVQLWDVENDIGLSPTILWSPDATVSWIGGLIPNTNYLAIASDAEGNLLGSQAFKALKNTGDEDATPATMDVLDKDEVSALFTFTPASDWETSTYELDYYELGTSPSTAKTILIQDASENQYLSELYAGTTYVLDFHAISNGQRVHTETFELTTALDYSAAELFVTGVTDTEADVVFVPATDAAEDASYTYSLGITGEGFTTAGTMDRYGFTSLRDLLPGIEYTFQVSSGEKVIETITFTTQGIAAPAMPELTLSEISYDSFDVKITPGTNRGETESYTIQVLDADDELVQTKTVTDADTYTIDGLDPDMFYTVNVIATGPGGSMESELSFFTLELPVAPPASSDEKSETTAASSTSDEDELAKTGGDMSAVGLLGVIGAGLLAAGAFILGRRRMISE